MAKKEKSILKGIWYFIWEEDSLASWLVNIAIAFILVKFVIYPGLGLMFGTSYPVVAVVSGSMTHGQMDFNKWWEQNGGWYEENDLTKEQFKSFRFHNGFNEGDIMVLLGPKPKNIKIGQIIVYESHQNSPPIIHRVVSKEKKSNTTFFKTKGDNNLIADQALIHEKKLVGKAVLRIPYLGWVKIAFTNLIKILF